MLIYEIPLVNLEIKDNGLTLIEIENENDENTEILENKIGNSSVPLIRKWMKLL